MLKSNGNASVYIISPSSLKCFLKSLPLLFTEQFKLFRSSTTKIPSQDATWCPTLHFLHHILHGTWRIFASDVYFSFVYLRAILSIGTDLNPPCRHLNPPCREVTFPISFHASSPAALPARSLACASSGATTIPQLGAMAADVGIAAPAPHLLSQLSTSSCPQLLP